MIYLFTFGNIHKFYLDGKIYMHNYKDGVFFVDEDYKDNTRSVTYIPKFEYTLPDTLIIDNSFEMTYIETTEYYILKAIFKDL